MSVEQQNLERTTAVLDEISRLENTSQYEELDAVIKQVLTDNLAQARAQELLGADSSGRPRELER